MVQARFDLGAVFAAVADLRCERGLTWASLSSSVGVSASTIRRFETADDAEADGVLAVIRWLDQNPESFVVDGTVAGYRLKSGPGYVRVDMSAVARASREQGLSRRSRTTIQHLTSVSENAMVPIASLTRLSST